MKTIKLKIKNDLDFTKELKLFNSIVRYSYNRFKQKLSQKEVRNRCNQLFNGNSWFIQSAIKEGKSVYQKFKNKKVIFGGKFNLKQYMKKIISKDEYCLNKLMPITIQGQKLKNGNRLFNFDFKDNKVTLKLSKIDHRDIILPELRNNLRKQFLELQRLIEQKKITITVKFNNEYIWFVYDESLLNTEKFKNLKSNRVLGIDLNPNYIGLSILQFNKQDKFKVLDKKVYDLSKLNKTSKKSSEDKKSKYLNNKRNFELIQICHQINNLMNIWKCGKLCIEDLNIKSSNKKKGKRFNRLCNNVWNRNLIVNKLKLLSNIHGYQIVEVNPIYSSFIGNILYGDQHTPDMVASSIELARRGYKKYKKGWFYPVINVDNLNEQWKQTLKGVYNWKEAFNKLKNLNMKYRFQLIQYLNNAVFSKFYKQKTISVYSF